MSGRTVHPRGGAALFAVAVVSGNLHGPGLTPFVNSAARVSAAIAITSRAGREALSGPERRRQMGRDSAKPAPRGSPARSPTPFSSSRASASALRRRRIRPRAQNGFRWPARRPCGRSDRNPNCPVTAEPERIDPRIRTLVSVVETVSRPGKTGRSVKVGEYHSVGEE